MNKYQDALDFIEKNSCHQKKACNECDFNRICNSFAKEKLDVLQELVDKATPKKVEKNIEGASYCHNCKVVVANKNIINDLNYCHYCGKALDWSDEE